MNGIVSKLINKIRYYIPVILLPLILFSEPLFRGEALFWGLPATQFIPWRYYAWQLLTSGQWPLWNPLNGMGAPLLANYQLAFFYPPGWILFLFQAVGGTTWMAWGYLLVNTMHLSWAGIGMMRFLRGLGVGHFGQILSGIAFSMGGFFIARIGTASMIWAGSWLPWSMLGGLAIFQWVTSKQSRPFPFYLIAIFTMQLLAGHAQLTLYSMELVAGWLVFQALTQKKKKFIGKAILSFSLVMILALCLSAIQLLPTAEYLNQSQRSEAVDFEVGLTYSFWPWRLLTFFSPDYFGSPANGSYYGYASYWEDAVYLGMTPLLLALLSSFYLVKEYRKKVNNDGVWILRGVFFWIVILIGVLFSLGKFTPIFPFLFMNVPTFDLFNAPARYMIWVVFSIAVLAGLMTDKWRFLRERSVKNLKRAAIVSAGVTLSAIIVWIFLKDIRATFVSATAYGGILAFAFCILTLKIPYDEINRKHWEFAVIGILCLDLLFCWWNLTPTIEKGFYDTPGRANAQNNQSGRLFLLPNDEYDIKFNRFFRFDDFNPIEDWRNLRVALMPNLNLLEDIAMVNNFDPIIPRRYSRVMNELGLMDLTLMENWLGWMDVSLTETKEITTTNGVKFTANDAWGRFRWSSCIETAIGEEDAWEKTKTKIRVDNEPSYFILESYSNTATIDCRTSHQAIINLEEETPTTIRLKVDTISDGFMSVADVYYPGWSIEIDGKDAEVIRADFLFYATYVPSGSHIVEIKYFPKTFVIGGIISGSSLLFVILLVIIYQKNLQKTRS